MLQVISHFRWVEDQRRVDIINSTGNTFKISLTSGGAAVDITDIGVGRHFIFKI